MGRSTTAIQAEIDILETELQSAASILASVGSDSTTVTKSRAALEKRLDQLYIQLGRTNGTAPMIVRGVVHGLGGTS